MFTLASAMCGLATSLGELVVFRVVGVAAVIFGALFVMEHRESKRGRFDLSGFVLAGAGLGALMYGVSEGPTRGWASIPVLFGVLYLVPLYYQDARGLSALNSGLSTFPEAIGVLIAAQVVSRYLYPSIGPRRLMAAGLTGIAVVTVAMAGASGSLTNLWYLRSRATGAGMTDPTGTQNTDPALRLIVTGDPNPVSDADDPTGRRNSRSPSHPRPGPPGFRPLEPRSDIILGEGPSATAAGRSVLSV